MYNRHTHNTHAHTQTHTQTHEHIHIDTHIHIRARVSTLVYNFLRIHYMYISLICTRARINTHAHNTYADTNSYGCMYLNCSVHLRVYHKHTQHRRTVMNAYEKKCITIHIVCHKILTILHAFTKEQCRN